MPCPCAICQKTGACCKDGACTQKTCQDCETDGGLWQGFGTECDGSDCPCSTPADHNACQKCENGTVVASCPDGRECCSGRCCRTGDMCCDYGCCYCAYPHSWRITDAGGRLHAFGNMSGGKFFDLPNPFTPLWYDSKFDTYELRVAGCNGDAFEVVSFWSMTVVLCGTTSDRYPGQDPLGGATVPPPSNCAKKLRRCTNDCPSGGCDDCPDLERGSTGPGLSGAQGGVAYRFTGAIDGEWTNLLNWQDASGLTPASRLPGPSDDVAIDGAVTSKPTDYTVSVRQLLITTTNFAIPATCVSLLCRGKISRPASPVCPGYFGHVTYTSSALFQGTSSAAVLEGEVTQATGASAAAFASPAYVADDSLANGGRVNGSATFSGDTYNAGVVYGNATFSGTAENRFGVVGTSTFFNSSRSTATGQIGNAVFNDTSVNAGLATFAPGQTATFNGSSRNTGTVQYAAVFNDNACNSGFVFGSSTPSPPPSCP